MKFITGSIARIGKLAVAVSSLMLCQLSTDARNFKLMIDPGHGGKDMGAPGKITNEKTVVLDVGKRLKKIIEKEHPEVSVMMTRDSDVFVPLKDRASMANKADADLFISIHCDAVANKSRAATVQGSTVYVIGPAKTGTNMEVVKRENSVIELEDGYQETYKDVESISAEQLIMLELNQNLAGSVDFATKASEELHGTAARSSRGDKSVMPCGFYVLVYTKMPSVLVELDFICNPTVEKFLHSDDGKDKCARALANAFTSYYKATGAYDNPDLLPGSDTQAAPTQPKVEKTAVEKPAKQTNTNKNNTKSKNVKKKRKPVKKGRR